MSSWSLVWNDPRSVSRWRSPRGSNPSGNGQRPCTGGQLPADFRLLSRVLPSRFEAVGRIPVYR